MAQSASRSPSFAPDGVPERAVAYGIFVRLDCWCLVWALWRKGIPGGRQTEPDRLDIWTASKRERSPSTIGSRQACWRRFIALRPQRRLCAADSTGRCNTFAEHLSGCVEAQRLARPLVQLSRNGVELKL